MKGEGSLRHFVYAGILAVLLYAVLFWGIESRRVAQQGWTVEFSTSAQGTPQIVISQPDLEIRNVAVSFPGMEAPSPAPQVITFDQPRPFPHPIPYGECVFADLTFLPGTVAMDVFGHRVELLPSRLIVDAKSYSWHSGTNIVAPRINSPSSSRPESK